MKTAAARTAVFAKRSWILERDPDAVAPVATAFMLAPFVMVGITPLPSVGVDRHAKSRVVWVCQHSPAPLQTTSADAAELVTAMTPAARIAAAAACNMSFFISFSPRI
jgi:hypothetical protein